MSADATSAPAAAAYSAAQTPPVAVGARLFLAAAPGLPVGAELSEGTFGSRLLARRALHREERSGAELAACFDLGPAAFGMFPLEVPRPVTVADPVAAVGVLGELAFEVVRLREFPRRPSRLDCLFLWRAEPEARAWFAERTWPCGLYAAEVLACRRAFVADLEQVQFPAGDGTVAALMEQARRYWGACGEGARYPEVLLEGRVRIVECLAMIADLPSGAPEGATAAGDG